MPGGGSLGRIAREKGDRIWYWLLRNGPHGSGFNWAPQLNGRYDSVEHLKRVIAEWTEQDRLFPVKARLAALEALAYEQPAILRRAIQVLAIVGTDEDLTLVGRLQGHPNEAVANDARSCLFERGIKFKRRRNSP